MLKTENKDLKFQNSKLQKQLEEVNKKFQKLSSDFKNLQDHINCNSRNQNLYLIFKFVSECQAHKISSVSQAVRNKKASCQIL